MKIVHLCLSNFYVDKYSYQENELVAQNVADGHDVTVIASTESFGEQKDVVYLPPGRYVGSDGACVIRLPYRKWLPHGLMRKVRMHPGVYRLLEQLAPDVVFFHGTGGWELLTAARYKRDHPKIRLLVDSHTDANNSARGRLSRKVLHGVLYRQILQRSLGGIEKILCVNIDAMDFAHEVYGIPKEKLEFYPLGGRIVDDHEYEELRCKTRQKYGLADTDLLFVQSGKMDGRKRVVESLRAFTAVPNERVRFFLAGHVHEDVAADVDVIVGNDKRISFLGWMQPDDLFALLCAADIYVQPGTQSVTMQMSLCARCAVILDDVAAHQPYLAGNGWLVGKQMSLSQAFAQVVALAPGQLKEMKTNSGDISRALLDYSLLARRIYN